MTRPANSSPKVDSSLATYLRTIVREPMVGICLILGIGSTYLASRYLGAWAAAVVCGLSMVVVGLSWSRLVAELGGSVEHSTRLAFVDDLTGLANDRSFRAALRMELARSNSPRTGLTLALADVDQFKAYNDTFGHPAGDDALKEFGRILVETAGDHAPVYRLGGDEFAVILRDVDSPRGFEIAERMRAAVEAHPWPGRPITASLGLATMGRVGRADDPSTLFGLADRALYRAKRDGGNKVVLGGEGESSTA